MKSDGINTMPSIQMAAEYASMHFSRSKRNARI